MYKHEKFASVFAFVLISVAASSALCAEPAAKQTSGSVLSFSGLHHAALGETQMVIQDDLLKISSMKGGAAGVRVDLDRRGEIRGLGAVVDFRREFLKNGVVYVASMYGAVEGIPDQPIGSLTLESVGEEVWMTPSFAAIGASTYRVELYNEGELVHTSSGMSGVAIIADAPDAGSDTASNGPLVPHFCILGSGIISFRSGDDDGIGNNGLVVVGGPRVMANEVVFYAENPLLRSEVLSAVDFRTLGIGEFTVLEEHTHITDLPH